MSRSAKFYLSKDQEKYYQLLHDLYHAEELAKLPDLVKNTWKQARDIYNHTKSLKPFYIVLMVVQVHERTQDHLCQFMVVTNTKNTGEKIPNSLVWFCDKSRNIFSLATDLCDISPMKHWGEKTLPSPSEKMLEQEKSS